MTRITPDLGRCCACRTRKRVRNVLCLKQKAPTPGWGWGCLVCGLPMDGAIAVLCDRCEDSGRKPVWACRGYPGSDGRIPIAELTGSHEHNMARHQADEPVLGVPGLPFSGELMTCVMCEQEHRSNPFVESHWRCLEVDGVRHYVCPRCMPPDGSSQAAYKQAYQKVLTKIQGQKTPPEAS